MEQKKPDLSRYDKIKEYKGKKYSGVKVGHGHKWYYQEGVWKETKTAPNKWKIHYAVGKRRAGKAPEGSGAAVGTQYRWYIIADQVVKKLDANNYSTEMTGVKYKIAHKRAEKDKWSAPDEKQRREMVKALKEVIADLENKPEEETQVQVNAKEKPKRTRQTQLLLTNP